MIRDKHTHKTKGFGFVSFKDPHDFINAMKEVNGETLTSTSLGDCGILLLQENILAVVPLS